MKPEIGAFIMKNLAKSMCLEAAVHKGLSPEAQKALLILMDTSASAEHTYGAMDVLSGEQRDAVKAIWITWLELEHQATIASLKENSAPKAAIARLERARASVYELLRSN